MDHSTALCDVAVSWFFVGWIAFPPVQMSSSLHGILGAGSWYWDKFHYGVSINIFLNRIIWDLCLHVLLCIVFLLLCLWCFSAFLRLFVRVLL